MARLYNIIHDHSHILYYYEHMVNVPLFSIPIIFEGLKFHSL